MNDQAMRAEAVAERDGKIVAVGSRDEVMKLKGPDTQVLDLGGAPCCRASSMPTDT